MVNFKIWRRGCDLLARLEIAHIVEVFWHRYSVHASKHSTTSKSLDDHHASLRASFSCPFCSHSIPLRQVEHH